MSMDTGQASDRLTRILDEVEGQIPSPSASDASSEGTQPAATLSEGDEGETGGGGGLGSLLGGLTADPTLLSSLLPALLSAFGGTGGNGGNGEKGGNGGSSEKGERSGQPTPPPSTATSAALGRPLPLDRHTALLLAVKPYLGERRQATADTVLRLCRVWDALSRAGITPAMLSGLLSGTGGASAAGTVPRSTDNRTGG